MLLNQLKISQEDDQMDTHEDHYMKIEALNYLKKNLINEDYANCTYTIQIARKFGAQRWEIDEIINRYTRLKYISISSN